MSAAVQTAPRPLVAPAEHAAADGGTTLAERLDAVIEALHAEGTAACPVCEGRVEPAREGGRCRDCGSRVG
jgi:tRNA(Ile2) C34 agmatinyltransferase TiaS